MRHRRIFVPVAALVSASVGAPAAGGLPRHALPYGIQILGGVHVAGIDLCAETACQPSGLVHKGSMTACLIHTADSVL